MKRCGRCVRCGNKMIYQSIKQKLKAAGIENPELEARIFLKEYSGASDADILTGNIPSFDETKLEDAITRRLAGEPVGRIIGYREFWGRKFYLSPATLEPRPDTETLIEAVLEDKLKPKRILDLGTGTGCILLTLLHEIPESVGVGVDLSLEACETARGNAEKQGIENRVSFINGSWADSFKGQFDLIVSNPPYIPSETVENLDRNVRDFDPRLALDGGKDGVDPYRNLLRTLKNLLAPGGRIFFEIGIHQVPDLQRLIDNNDATLERIYKDLGGIERVLKISYGDK